MANQALERLILLTVDASQAVRELQKIEKNTGGLLKGFNQIRQAAIGALSFTFVGRGLGALAEAEDKINLMAGSFEALTGSAERAADMVGRVFDTVRETGSELEDTTSTFQRLTIGLNELGASNAQIEAIAQTFIKLGRVSGTSMFNTNAALVQFSQGLASGRLQGDELRSIMERLPLITRLIADEYSKVNGGIQISVGEVKQLGREGKITAEIMANALLNATDEVAKAFEELPFTLSQELNVLRSTFTQFLSDFAQATGIGDAIRGSVGGLNDFLGEFRKNASTFADDIGTMIEAFQAFYRGSFVFRTEIQVISSMIVALLIPSIVKLGVALRAFAVSNPWLALATGALVAVTAIIRYWDDLKAYFQFRLPEALSNLRIAWLEFYGFLELKTQLFLYDMKKKWADTVNEITGFAGKVVASFSAFPGAGDSLFGKIETGEFEFVSSVADEIAESTKNAAFFADLYNKYLAGAAESGQNLSEALSTVGGIPKLDPKVLKEYQNSLEDLKNEVLNTLDPLREIREKILLLNDLVDMGKITKAQADAIIGIWDGSTEALKEMEEQARKTQQQWDQFIVGVEESVDPFKAVERELREIDMAMERGLDPEVAEKRKKQILDTYEDTAKGIKGLAADLSKAGNSFIETFATDMTDALLDGSLSFSEFTESLLKDLARLILRAVIFNSLMSAIGGTEFGKTYGIGTASAGSNAGAFGVGTLATGDSGDNAVGVLQPAVYGHTPRNAASNPVSITVNNNAPVEVTTKTKQRFDGSQEIEILIQNQVAQAINSGGLDSAFRSNYGLSRRGY